jgi:hypothetical protein
VEHAAPIPTAALAKGGRAEERDQSRHQLTAHHDRERGQAGVVTVPQQQEVGVGRALASQAPRQQGLRRRAMAALNRRHVARACST